ncbi:unnamed protein product [Natator depressus]
MARPPSVTSRTCGLLTPRRSQATRPSDRGCSSLPSPCRGGTSSTTSCRWLPASTASSRSVALTAGATRSFSVMWSQEPGSHQDARLLGTFFAMVSRYKNWEDPNASVNQFEKEKRDYAFCLEQSLLAYSPEYVLLVEDDAVPEEEIFPVLQHLLLARLSKPHLKDALYLKLYHPERLQRYINPEPMRILEWLGLGMFLGPLLSFVYSWVSGRPSLTWPIVLFFALYSMALAELMGRHYLLELRRLAPALYNVVPATECCTPAMLFSAPSARRVLGYLQELHCRRGFAKDIAFYSLLRTKGEKAYVVEPNLIMHVGMFSSLRPNDSPKLL